ncbi:MAG: NUDIX hydrolase [Nitrospirota bacterium]|nr:MAG: NUDIX hydrolase [Nitrospirota bacterium]
MSRRPASIRTRTSAGGVVYRENNGSVDVVLISLRGGTILTLPKGTIDNDESVEETALREVREETGLTGEIKNDLGSISYWFYDKDDNIKYRKTVHFFLLRYISGETGDHDSEVEDAVWIDIDSAIDKVVYRSDKQILNKVRNILNGQDV